MGNYLFMLENHLTPEQNRVLNIVHEAASAAGTNVFLTGAAMRDMLGGYPVRFLEFVLEGNATKFAKGLPGTVSVTPDETWKQAEVLFEGNVPGRIIMAREERYAKPGGKPHMTPAGIHEHLRNRDFTINSIAISLGRGSKGLLLDPNNGMSDLQQKELRTVYNHALYDQPVRLFQLIRYKAQFGFTIVEKTQAQYSNAREAGMEKFVPPEGLLTELRHAARDANPGAIVEAWAEEGLLKRISPALTGPKLNTAGFAKLAKARQTVPFDVAIEPDYLALFLWVLGEKLPPKERADLAEAIALPKDAADNWHKLETRSNRLAKELESATRPSKVYAALNEAPAERALFLLTSNAGRSVQERIRNYFTKYLAVAAEVTDADVAAPGFTPGTPKWQKRKAEVIAKRLDARPKKPVEPPVEAAPPPPIPPPNAPRARSF